MGRILLNERCPRTSATSTRSWAPARSWAASSSGWPAATPRRRWRAASTASRTSASASPPSPGLTISLDDEGAPRQDRDPGAARASRPEATRSQFRRGIISDGERRQKEIETWLEATQQVHRNPWWDALSRGSQPGQHDGGLGRAGEHDAAPPDRRDAWRGGQPARRHDLPADQVQLPRGPVGAGVLHLHAGRPQGARGHGVAHRRLRLPDAPAGGRGPGTHHQRRGPVRAGNEPVPGIWRRPARTGDRPIEVRLLGRVLADDVTLGRRHRGAGRRDGDAPRWPRCGRPGRSTGCGCCRR